MIAVTVVFGREPQGGIQKRFMNKILSAIAIGAFVLAGVGCSALDISDETIAASASETSTSAQVAPAAPTAVTLATPTPRPAPSTPTPHPVSPTAEATESGAVTPATEAQPVVADDMVLIPAGPFTMGNDGGDHEDKPAHEVELPDFEIDRFEVTNADFAAFAQATGTQTYAEKAGYRSWRDEWQVGVEDNHPVVMVTWDDANAFCEWAGKRLPSEAEWEKAARGEDPRTYPWGDEWDATRANVKDAGLRGTAAVGSFGAGASPYGVEDMIGNVWEWTADWYQPYPGNTSADAYYGETFRVTRGGGWFDEKPQASATNRNAADPAKTANDDLGFRCAR